MKRTLSTIIVLLLMITLCACGSSYNQIIEPTNSDSSSNVVTTATSAAFTSAPSTATTPTIEPVTSPTIEVTTAPTTQPSHVHSFSDATCTSPKTCSCGATEGEANRHEWKDATCSDPKTCTVCGTTSGLAAAHSFSNGKCTICGKNDPDFDKEIMVWIPTKGGKKYHTSAGCSNMIDPDKVTLSQAEYLGFTPCKRCH